MRFLLPCLILILSLTTGADADTTKAAKARWAKLLGELQRELEAPGTSVSEAAPRLGSADGALAFVRDEVSYVSYRGAWAGPDAVLRTRVANATDKARLLAALLRELGYEVRLAHANRPEGAIAHRATARLELPALGKLREALGEAAPAAPTTDNALRREIDRAASLIRERTAGLSIDAQPSDALRAAERSRPDVDWVWVQARKGGGAFEDFDPTFPALPRPKRVFAPFRPPAVAMIVELVSQDAELATWAGPADEVLGRDVQLTFMPAYQPLRSADKPETVMAWRPLLVTGTNMTQGRVFRLPDAPNLPTTDTVPNPLTGERIKVKITPAPTAHELTLRVKFADPGGRRAWRTSYQRTLHTFTRAYDPRGIVAWHRLGIGVGYVPPHVMAANAVADALHIHAAATGGEAPARSGSSRTARVLNALHHSQLALAPRSLKLGWKGPAVVLESTLLVSRERTAALTRLDVWHLALGPEAGSSRADRVRWGLATLAVEGSLLRTDSVSARLTAEPDRLQARVVDGAIELRNGAAPAYLWRIDAHGDLRGTVTTRSVLAKGAVQESPVGLSGFNALASAAMTVSGSPAGMLGGAVGGYLSWLSQQWRSISKRIEEIGQAIESGNPIYLRHMLGDTSGFQRELLDGYVREIGRGALRGWTESALGALLGSGLPEGMPDTEKLVADGLIAAGLSYPDELWRFSEAIDFVVAP